jgi:hypothetical protein
MGVVAEAVGDFIGNTVSSIGDIGESIIDAGGDVIQSVGDGLADAAQAVGDAFGAVAESVGDVGEAIDQVVNDVIPGGWYMVGAIALTVATAGTVNLEGQALAAGAAGEVVAASAAAEAAAAGVAASQGVAAASATTAAAATGSTAAQAALQAAATGALKGAAIGAAKSAITGGDIFDGALNGALTGAVGGGIGNYAGGLTAGTDFADYAKTVGAVAGGTAGGATGAALNGGDPLTGALIGGISGGTSSLASNVIPTDINPAITSGALGAAKAAVMGGDPLLGGLSAAGSSLVSQGVNAGYDAVKSGLDQINQPPSLSAELDALAKDPAYQDVIGSGDGSVTVTQAPDLDYDVQPTQPAPVETGTTTVTNPDGSITTFDLETGNEIGTTLSPLDNALTAIIDSTPKTTPTNPALNNQNVGVAENPTQAPEGALGTGTTATDTGNITAGDGTGLSTSGTGTGGGGGLGGSGSGGTGTGGGGGGSGISTGGLGTGSMGYTTGSMPTYAQDVTAGLVNLTPGLTRPMNYNLSGLPSIDETESPQNFATGGSATSRSSLFDSKGNYNYGNLSDTPLTAALTKHNVGYTLTGLPSKAEGGVIEGHNPQFFSEGGALANRYVKGAGDGTSDSIPAMLANGEFVIPADIVSSLGNGSNDSGAKILDEFLRVVREHKKKHDGRRLPPDSKGPLSYLTDAKRKVRK